MTSDFSELRSETGKIGIKYSAKAVHVVAGGSGTINVFLDGEQANTIDVEGNALYNLVALDSYGGHVLELIVEGDVEIYTFTFG